MSFFMLDACVLFYLQALQKTGAKESCQQSRQPSAACCPAIYLIVCTGNIQHCTL